MPIVNTAEMARVLGVSHTAIKKAVDAGRISIAQTDEKGRSQFDTEKVIADWAANSNQSKKRSEKAGGRPRLDGTPNERRPDLPDKPLADELVPPVGVAGGVAGATAGGGEPDGEINFNRANAREKHFKAKLAELDYEQKVGTLVPIADVAQEVAREYGRVRARLLAIASKLAPDVVLTDDVAECRALIEAAVNDALNELTADIAAHAAAEVREDAAAA